MRPPNPAEVSIEEHPDGFRARVDTFNSLWAHPGTRPTEREALEALILTLHAEVERLARFRRAVDAARRQYDTEVREDR